MRASPIIVGSCLLLASCSSSGPVSSTSTGAPAPTPHAPVTTAPPDNVRGGVGSTVAVMSATHGPVATPTGGCASPGTCFGPPVPSTAGGVPATFTGVVVVNDRIGGYVQHLAPGSTTAQALAQVLRFLPPDATTTALATVTGAMTSCAYVNVSSPTLAALFPGSPASAGSSTDAVVGVEFSTTTAQGFTVYAPDDVQQARLTLGPDNATLSC